MGGVIVLFVVMLIIAGIAFAPLGYFIKTFTEGSGEKLGKTDPKDHSVEKTQYYAVIDNFLGKLLGK